MNPTLSNGYWVSCQVLAPADHRSPPVRAGRLRWAVVVWVKAVASEGKV